MNTAYLRENIQTDILRQMAVSTRKLELLDALKDVGELPEEASLTTWDLWTSSYANANGTRDACVTVRVTLDDKLDYQNRIRPLGQVFRAFKAHGITRSIDESGSVTFKATIPCRWYGTVELHIMCGQGAVSPNCKIETKTVTETVTRTVVKVTCPEPVGTR